MIVHASPTLMPGMICRLPVVLLGWLLIAVPASTGAQTATQPAVGPARASEEPRYPQATPVPEDMMRRRPRQVIALPSEPGEYGEDPTQLSSGVLGKLPPDVHRLPEGYVIASQQMSVERQPEWTVCYLPDERLVKLPLGEAGSWAGDLDGGRLPAGLVKACQDAGVAVAPESRITSEEKGLRWRVADPRHTLIVERDREAMVVRSALTLRLLPNKRLTMLEAVLTGSQGTPSFAFTGRVTEFMGVNYLLAEHLAEVVDVSEPAAEAPSDRAEKETPGVAAPDQKPATAPAGEPRPEDIIKQLLERKPRRALVLPETMPAAPQEKPVVPAYEGAPVADQLWPEETMIVDRPGRVVPGEQWWTFAFEDKGQQPTRKPVRLLPNRMLEDAIALGGDQSLGIILVVSGELTEYRGTNYLLLRKVLVQRDWGNLR